MDAHTTRHGGRREPGGLPGEGQAARPARSTKVRFVADDLSVDELLDVVDRARPALRDGRLHWLVIADDGTDPERSIAIELFNMGDGRIVRRGPIAA